MELRAFRGWRYRPEDGNVTDRIAPPYDILDPDDKAALLRRDERNIVAVDLPHVPPGEAGPDAEYQAAAETIERWKRSGVLRQEPRPALYVCEQTYTWAGRSHTRRALIAGVRATPPGREIIPHEHTFAGPKADRLKLTEHTRMQLSPIFGLFDDPGGQVEEILARQTSRDCDLFGELHGVGEKLWVVTDARTIRQLQRQLADAPAHIADGHHRYLTAINYRDRLRAERQIDDDHEANFVMFALVAREDPGLLVLPTHRTVSGLRGDFDLDSLTARRADFCWQDVQPDRIDLRRPGQWLRAFGTGAMALIGPEAKRVVVGRLDDPEAMRRAAPERSDTWRALDVAVLQKLIIEDALEPWKTDAFAVSYTSDAPGAAEAARTGRAQLAVLLQPTPVEAVERIGAAAETMPQKSTYFYPKIATGLVLKPLE